MNFYLNAKNWQLFLLFALTIILCPIFYGHHSITDIFLMVTFFIVWFGWLISIALACSKKLSKNLAGNPKLMFFSLIYAVAYIAFAGFYFSGSNMELPNYMVTFHILFFVMVLYSLGFTAKQLAALDQNRNVSFFSYFGLSILFYFFPVGVWFVQPKVNQLLGTNKA